MSVLRYCCFRWLVYDRALVFEPSRPLACIMMLVWLIYVFRVVLWYLPVSPWSWSYTFACMISVQLNRGRHKLVSEPTACRNPPSNSLAEVESSRWKTFTNMAVRPMGPRRHWVVLGSFTPRSLLWDSELSSIRVKWSLLNLTIGSRYHFHPESPLLLMIVCCTRRPWRYSPLLTRELVFIAFAIPLPPSTLMDNYL